MAHVRDRWTDPNPAGPDARPKRIRNERWGKGKRWQARWIENGHEHVQACATKDEADLVVAEKEAGVVHRKVPTITVEERFEVWKRSRLRHAPKTRETVQSALNAIILPTLGVQPVAALDRQQLQDAVTEWAGHWSASRVRVAWSFVSSMLKQCEADKIIDRAPQGIILPEVDPDPIVPLLVSQVEQIAARVPKWFRAMVVLDAASGLRSGELRGLTRDRCVDGVLMVDRQLVGAKAGTPIFGPPKSKAGIRRVPIDPDTWAVLQDHLEKWGSDDLVFRTRHRTPISRTRMSEMWRDASEGMEGLRRRSGWHDLRHFHASMLIAGGMSVTAVASRLGHKDSTETLRTYAHLWPTDDERAVAIVQAQLKGSSILARSTDGPGLAA